MLPAESSFPVFSQGAQSDVRFRFVILFVAVIAPASLGDVQFHSVALHYSVIYGWRRQAMAPIPMTTRKRFKRFICRQAHDTPFVHRQMLPGGDTAIAVKDGLLRRPPAQGCNRRASTVAI